MGAELRRIQADSGKLSLHKLEDVAGRCESDRVLLPRSTLHAALKGKRLATAVSGFTRRFSAAARELAICPQMKHGPCLLITTLVYEDRVMWPTLWQMPGHGLSAPGYGICGSVPRSRICCALATGSILLNGLPSSGTWFYGGLRRAFGSRRRGSRSVADGGQAGSDLAGAGSACRGAGAHPGACLGRRTAPGHPAVFRVRSCGRTRPGPRGLRPRLRRRGLTPERTTYIRVGRRQARPG